MPTSRVPGPALSLALALAVPVPGALLVASPVAASCAASTAAV